jgi:hypothetical protein
MMMCFDEEHTSGAVVGVGDWDGQPATAAAERIPDRGKQDSALTFAWRVPLTNAQRATLAEIAKRMGRRALEQVASVAQPETILAWYRKLIAGKFDGSKHRAYPGRPPVSREITELVLFGWHERIPVGDTIALPGALKNLGHNISDQTVGNILRRFGIAPAPKRGQQTTWGEFIRSHLAVLAGIDFFTVEVLTWRGLATYYVLFFLHLETHRVTIAGITLYASK